MQTIRSFIAVPLSLQVAANAARLVEKLSEPNDGIRWVPTDNLHLTLKFLGEVDNTEIPAVCDVIRSVTSSYEPFELDFAGVGGLPSLDRPRVLCVHVTDPTGALCDIVAKLEKKLAELRFKPEPRDYRPHLTLGRTKGGSRRASNEVVAKMSQYAEQKLGQMEVDAVELIASFLEKRGPSYQVMDTVELGTA
ncbi:RNA 2',3'-cyclic phosphodiesterase [Novipirellula artificiosorum]|uniref:RNA 2',3'-cyclic phosphodiesterase n=1 Tax=Novipirellula artificiosorum TaxID=2528016 RepID=A0A5C6E235_9BACT|nr:RNA 2',3'-cyclic phosphodiesterase [Novipirellula artificiosorum]TWU42037.1 2',5' RNA ligase family [Novipirellula artificiosorum]